MNANPDKQTANAIGVGFGDLLAARSAAIEKVVKELGDEKDKDGETSATRGVLIMLAREAAGQGFDEGIKFMAANDQALPRQ